MMDEVEASQEPTAPESAAAPPPDATPPAAPETIEAEPAEAGAPEAAAEAVSEPVVATADWSHLRGFQSVEAPAPELAERADYAEELGKELGVRAARFARSVDESIVLSSDGLMRWLGDPIARVVAGDKLLEPRPVLLADEALAGEERQTVETRAALWLGAHVRKVLGPLLALAEGADLPEPARPVATRIADALGVLEREGVRNEVRGLDQNARGALRKLGVRFGSLYIYVPALLKPAARGLSSLLWTLKRGAEAGADRLLGFSAAGRTSFANEGLLPPDSYRVAGFRLCGERVVRVDIIERLSDLIRAAIPDHMRGGGPRPSDAHGFLVTPQMTSLTGCSGEAFASILRSLGFEPVKVTRAAYEAARPKAPTEPVKPVEAPVAETEAAAPEAIPAVTLEGEAAPAETVEMAALPATESQAGDAPEAIAAEAPETEAAPAETVEAATVAATEPEAGDALEEIAAEAPEAAEAEAAAGVETETMPVAAAEPEADETTAAAAPVEGGEEEIEVWRPIPRRPRAPRHAHAAQGQPRAEASGEEARGRRDRGRRGPRPETRDAAPAGEAPTVQGERPPRPERQERQERRPDGPRRFEGKPREERDARKPQFPPRRESRPPDPDSPFAKLAALKPLLERRDKRP